jgi:hypothetical protein
MKTLVKYCGLAALFAGAALYLSSCEDDVREPYGGPWRIVKTPPDVEASVGEIQFFSKNDGWAIAGKYLLRFNGKEWTKYKKIVHPDPLCDYGFGGFQMLNGSEGWFVGTELVPDPRGGGRTIRHSMIWHYDGETFNAVNHPDKRWLGTVWFNNPNDGWVFGYGALHYRDGEWEEVDLKAIVQDCFFFGEDDGWAVSMGSIWFWDGVAWTKEAECGPFEDFSSIAFNGNNSGWAGFSAGWGGYPHMFHYDGREWDYYNEKFGEDILDIDFANSNYGCAVGDVVFIYNGGEWIPVWDPLATFWCVECVGPDDIWAGSDTGDIYHFTGFN